MRIAEPSISTLLASETCGTPSRSASIAAITPIRASVDSEPADHQVEAGFVEDLRRARRRCDRASEPARPSSSRCTALSAPMDRALRMDSAAFSGPMVRMVTSASVPAARCASAICSALLDGVLVKLVDEPVHRRAVQRAVRVRELAFGPGIWHLLDQHDDVHRLHRPPCSLAYSLPNRAATPGTGSTGAMLLVSSLSRVILMATRSRPFHSIATCRPPLTSAPRVAGG